MIGIIGIVCIKKTPVEMRGPGTSKHCITNMVADEEAVIAAVITAIFLVNKEEKENREILIEKIKSRFYPLQGHDLLTSAFNSPYYQKEHCFTDSFV